jgi:CubicO group peptidase (beta-lactamase class C family)
VKTSAIELHGSCASKFARVQDAFITNFREHGEIGADFALIVGGEVVADLWAGSRDVARTKPWTRRTITNIWSSTKGINGTCFAMIVDRGLASYEDKVSQYWPEFGAAGKQDITIGMLLAHQAGLSGFTTPATIADLLSGEVAAGRLAAQAPIWEPGTTSGYHGMTLGILATALFARIERRSIKRFVAEEIAEPFGLDLSIGVEPGDEDRVAEMLPTAGLDTSSLDHFNVAQHAAFTNPETPGSLSNDAAWRAADLPAANGYGNARALAGMYGLLLRPRADGKALVAKNAVAQATRCRFKGIDSVKGTFTRWSAGFWLNPGKLYGPNLEAFGHSGWGGSFGFADPIAEVAVAYTMNRMSDQFERDPRRRGLIDAVYASL